MLVLWFTTFSMKHNKITMTYHVSHAKIKLSFTVSRLSIILYNIIRIVLKYYDLQKKCCFIAILILLVTLF